MNLSVRLSRDSISTPPSPDIDDPFLPPSETAVVAIMRHILEKCKTYDGPSRNRPLSPSRSLNLTEAEIAPSVHGHRVKAEIAPLVGAIFDRYGDITASSNVKSPSIMYQRLEKKTFQDITRAEINGMLDELHQYQAQKFNVEWLLEKIKQISEVKRSSTQRYLGFKGEATKYIKVYERMEKEIQLNQRHIALIQKEMEANKADADKYTKMAVDFEVRVKALASQSLVHDLL